MKTTFRLFRSFLGISAAAILMFGCAELQTNGGGSGSSMGGSSAGSSTPVSSTDVASGHYGDTLEACLGRIPSGSTDSQRMLAELTCKRDEAARKSINAVPGN
ncbi:hypothetical protein [Candidatus Nitronereus thalassa]|uniref:Lipoprotein n=1 Tax=Candidatus Nitronereus thalassa TaxID=3020898 RepID=A0ABU3KBD2_9BACT|nr:hypothetical protein [Candidatus Nitronereus thalassa]MDT7043799.1 hypothetical protein [Candidatus Nitronereus thalassa]